MSNSLLNSGALAESIEKLRLTAALMFLFIGLSQLRQALEYILGSNAPALMNTLRTGLIIAIMVCVILLLRQWIKVRAQGCAHKSILAEAFIQHANNQAMAASWLVTLIVGMGMVEWQDQKVLFWGMHDVTALLPGRYYLLLLIGVMCLSYSLIFFWLYYRDEAELEEGGEGESES